MATRNPYTPGSGLFPPYFADRDREIRAFREGLQATRKGTPQHMTVIGEAGLGKTALLLKLRQVAAERTCLTSFVSADPDSATSLVGSIVRTLALQIRASYGNTVWPRLAKAMGLQEPSIPALDASLRLRFSAGRDARTTLRRHLELIWQQVRRHPPAIVILIDDLERLGHPHRAMATLRYALMSPDADRMCVMAIVASTPDVSFDQREATEASAASHFRPATLERLSDDAAYEALIRPLAGTSIRFDPGVADRIVELAAGHPYHLQELARHTFDMASSNHRVTSQRFELALEQAFYRISSTVFEPQLNLLSAAERQLLAVLSEMEQAASEAEVVRAAGNAGLDEAIVPKLLVRLLARGYLNQTDEETKTGGYWMPDPLFREFIRRHVNHSV